MATSQVNPSINDTKNLMMMSTDRSTLDKLIFIDDNSREFAEAVILYVRLRIHETLDQETHRRHNQITEHVKNCLEACDQATAEKVLTVLDRNYIYKIPSYQELKSL